MSKLTDLPNISKAIEKKLHDAGIATPEALARAGSREAFLRLRTGDPTVCLNMLYALEGAVRGARWHFLPESTKEELKAFYKGL